METLGQTIQELYYSKMNKKDIVVVIYRYDKPYTTILSYIPNKSVYFAFDLEEIKQHANNKCDTFVISAGELMSNWLKLSGQDFVFFTKMHSQYPTLEAWLESNKDKISNWNQ